MNPIRMTTPPPDSPSTLAQWPTLDQGYTRRAIAGFAFKHKWIILVSFLITATLVWLGLAKLPPTYTAQSKVLLRFEQEGSPSFLSGIAAYREPRDTDSASRKLETEMGLLAARPLAEQVVRSLDLKYDQVWHAPYITLLEPVSALYARGIAWFEGRPGESVSKGFDDTVREFGRALEVHADISKSAESTPNIVDVTFKASDPRVAREALDLLVRNYVAQGSSLDKQSGQAALDIVQKHLDDARTRVALLDDDLRRQLSASGLNMSDVISGPQPDAPLQPTSVDINDDPSTGTRDRSLIASDTNVVKALRMQYAQARSELSAARSIYTDKTERIAVLQARVADLRQRVQDESRRSADDQVRAKGVLRALAVAETSFAELSRKRDQIQLYMQMQPAQAFNRFIVEPALQPRTSEWRRTAIIGVAGSIAGLFLGFALAAVREYFDHRLGSAAEAEAFLGVPVLGVIPAATSQRVEAALAGGIANQGASD